MDGTFAVDVDDPNETVGDADYVFLGRVDEDVDTLYKDPVTIETSDGAKEVSTPYTNYQVTVLQNIKGRSSNRYFHTYSKGWRDK